MKKTSYLSLLLILLSACSSSPEVEVPEEVAQLENLTVIPADTEPSQSIDFNREVVYSDKDDVMLGRITSFTVDNEGRVFMADRDQNLIHMYESDGTYLRQVGSEGKGPGEFGNIGILQTDDQYLYAYDWNQHRVNVFFLESLEFSHSIPLLQEVKGIEELSERSPWRFMCEVIESYWSVLVSLLIERVKFFTT